MRSRFYCAVLVVICTAAQLLAAEISSEPGRRRAVRRPPPCAASPSVTESDVTAIAVDTTHIYFGDSSGNIHRVSKSGGAVESVSGMSGTMVLFAEVDDRNVYFVAQSRADGSHTIYSAPKNGGAPVILAGGFFVYRILPDGDWLYLVAPGTMHGSVWDPNGQILRVRRDGSHVETLASGLRGPVGMVIDGDELYFSERGTSFSDTSGGIRRMSKEGGSVTVVASLPGALMLAQDATHIFSVRVASSDLGAIDMISKSDGSVTPLVSGVGFDVLEPLEFFGDSLYFGNVLSSGVAGIEALRTATGERRTIAEVHEGGFPDFAIDSCGVYYSSAAGILRAGP